ncbi:MAG: hypothetical protein R6V28_04490 [Nitriliruptoraceae bacterium]
MPSSPRAACRRPLPDGPRAVALASVVLAVTVLVATPATAHPFVAGGGELPIDSAASITLDLAHGCGSESEGLGQDTLEVALEVPSWLRVLRVGEHPAYRHDLELADGRVSVVTWTVVGTAEPAPAFELDVVATGTVGQAGYLAVFQGCEERSHRWIGTPEVPADDPAINVRLTAPDPARPAPPQPPAEELPDGPAPQEPAGDGGTDADPGSESQELRDEAAIGQGGNTSVTASSGADVETGDGRSSTLRWLVGLVVAALGGLAAVLMLTARGRGHADRSTSP